jgi:cystathionine beta-lyase/cystathionine gamma-synthase
METGALHSQHMRVPNERPQAEALSMSSVWQFDSPDEADAAMASQGDICVYRRDGHPNERTLATKLAQLHGASRAVLTAQGMSAIGAVALATLRPGMSVWIGDELYGKTSRLFGQQLSQWGISIQTFAPDSQADIASLASSHPQMVVVETISNPRLRIPDLAELSAAVHRSGGSLVVDNTFATHLLCQPLSLGADFVVESLSKQVNGHSDSMLGVICGTDLTRMERVADVVSTFGLASSPLDCYLTHRGLMTLAIRMERACANAFAVAHAIVQTGLVETVDYPGIAMHPTHSHAVGQLRGGYGWMLSLRVASDRRGIERLFADLAPDIPFAPSLGDVVTTLSHPASTSHRSTPMDELQRLGITEGTIRISCGIEPTDWLVTRLVDALQRNFS